MQNTISHLSRHATWWLAKLAGFAWLVVSLSAFAVPPGAATDANAAYTRTINQRADKIVATLGISDTNKAARVLGLIAQQYRDLNAIHEARDAQIKTAKEKSAPDPSAVNAAIQAARNEARPRLEQLHGEFLARLSAELSPVQVDQVKDGMTYGVAHVTYHVYLKMYPELTAAQKAQIMAWLTEARELAMDGSTSEEKHAVFGKYKGRINNYLSKAGYDAKKGERNLKKAASPATE